MMRVDALNWHGYGGYTETTALSSKICFTEEDKSKRIIVHKTLLQSSSANEDESKQSIVNKTLSQNYSAEVDNLCSTKKDKSEYTVTYDVCNFNVSNVFERRRKNPDVSYERSYMVTSGNE